MRKSLSTPVLALCASITLLAGHTSASADDNDAGRYYYNTKTPYQPQAAVDAVPTPPPGFSPIYTTVLGRHGSRADVGKSRTKSVLSMLHEAKHASPRGLSEAGLAYYEEVKDVYSISKALPAHPELDADSQPGWGNLTQLGAQEWRGIGERNEQRNAELYAAVADSANDLSVKFYSSPVVRSQLSGINFARGLVAARPDLAGPMGFDDSTDVPVDLHVTNETGDELSHEATLILEYKNPNNPDYAAYKRANELPDEDAASKAAKKDPRVIAAAREILSKMYTPEYLGSMDDEEAVSQAYKLYTVAGYSQLLNQEPDAPTGGFTLPEILTPDATKYMSYVSDAHGFYLYGPGRSDSTDGYRLYGTLVKHMLGDVADRATGDSNVAGKFYFGHAETVGPVTSYLQIPLANHPTAPGEIFSLDTGWDSSRVVPMATNLQWDAFSNPAGVTIVRMLFNEQPTPFGPKCQPIADGSLYYTLAELQACVPLESVSDHSQARPPELYSPVISTQQVSTCVGDPVDGRAGLVGLTDGAQVEVVSAADVSQAGSSEQTVKVVVSASDERQLVVPVEVVSCSTATTTATATATTTAASTTTTTVTETVTTTTAPEATTVLEPTTVTQTTTVRPDPVTVVQTPDTVTTTATPTTVTTTAPPVTTTTTETPAPVVTTTTTTAQPAVVTHTETHTVTTTVTADQLPATVTETTTTTAPGTTVTVSPVTVTAEPTTVTTQEEAPVTVVETTQVTVPGAAKTVITTTTATAPAQKPSLVEAVAPAAAVIGVVALVAASQTAMGTSLVAQLAQAGFTPQSWSALLSKLWSQFLPPMI